MKRLIVILTILLIAVLITETYFLRKTRNQLIIDNKQLASIILKPSAPKKLYIFGCKKPSAAVLVFSNGNSYSMEMAELRKLKQRLPPDIPIITYQAPECRPPKT